MTLREVLARGRAQPKIGDHEIVTGPDGLGHMLVVTRNENKDYRENLEFMCRCDTLRGKDLGDLEIAPAITCMTCIQW